VEENYSTQKNGSNGENVCRGPIRKVPHGDSTKGKKFDTRDQKQKSKSTPEKEIFWQDRRGCRTNILTPSLWRTRTQWGTFSEHNQILMKEKGGTQTFGSIWYRARQGLRHFPVYQNQERPPQTLQEKEEGKEEATHTGIVTTKHKGGENWKAKYLSTFEA